MYVHSRQLYLKLEMVLRVASTANKYMHPIILFECRCNTNILQHEYFPGYVKVICSVPENSRSIAFIKLIGPEIPFFFLLQIDPVSRDDTRLKIIARVDGLPQKHG